MKKLHIEGTDDTPLVILDKENSIFEISGRSLPEDSVEFYRPVLEWIADYKKESNPTTEFTFKLEYANTASSKLVQEVMLKLKDIKGIKIIWCFQEDDEDMEESGHEFSEQVDMPFEFRHY